MRKPATIVIYTLTIISCFIVGILLTESILTAYAKKPGTGSYEFELQYLDGSPFTDYDWGKFSKGEKKEIECNLFYLGDSKAKVTWSMVNLPDGLDIEVWDQSHKKPKLWIAEKNKTLKPGDIKTLKIILHNVDVELGYYQDLVLRLVSMTSK